MRPPTPASDFAPGTVFAGHRIDAVAGRGGMGVVYRATQLALDRTVALKVIAPNLVEDAATRERFVRESKLAASIDHPNVIPIYYAGEEDGIAYIAMRYVAGDDLRSLVRREGPLAAERAAHIVAQIGFALDAAHAAGLVHRDVKPANVLLGPDDHVYLTDFGLTKHARSDSVHTKSGHWVGTLDYVAPEQIRAERVDARADVYALGCVLHYALTARVPFDRPSDEARLWAHISDPPPRPSAVVDGLSPLLDEVVERALAKQPEDRFPSTGDLGRAVRAAVRGEPCFEPERIVAVGSAAPDEAPTVDAPVRPVAAAHPGRPSTAETRAPAAGSSGGGSDSGGAAVSRRRRGLTAVAAVLATILAGAAGAVVAGGDGGSGTAPTPAPTATPGADTRTAEVTRTITAGSRPNGVAVTGSTVWVMSFGRSRLTRVDAGTGRRRRGPEIGIGGSDILTAGGSLYVVNSRERRVTRLDPRTGRELARVEGLTGQPTRAELGEGALWVAERTTIPTAPDNLLALDPETLEVRNRIPVAMGVQSVRTGGGAVWVLHRRTRALGRLDPLSGQFVRQFPVGENPEELAYAKGRVWVANRDDDSVTRVDLRSGRTATFAVPRGPVGIEARGDDVWVTSFLEGTVTRLDADRGRRVAEPLVVGVQPYALAVTPSTVWVTGVGDDTVTRVSYR